MYFLPFFSNNESERLVKYIKNSHVITVIEKQNKNLCKLQYLQYNHLHTNRNIFSFWVPGAPGLLDAIKKMYSISLYGGDSPDARRDFNFAHILLDKHYAGTWTVDNGLREMLMNVHDEVIKSLRNDNLDLDKLEVQLTNPEAAPGSLRFMYNEQSLGEVTWFYERTKWAKSYTRMTTRVNMYRGNYEKKGKHLVMCISNSGYLPWKCFLHGNSTKRDEAIFIGKHGEGLSLACVVFMRNNINVSCECEDYNSQIVCNEKTVYLQLRKKPKNILGPTNVQFRLVFPQDFDISKLKLRDIMLSDKTMTPNAYVQTYEGHLLLSNELRGLHYNRRFFVTEGLNMLFGYNFFDKNRHLSASRDRNVIGRDASNKAYTNIIIEAARTNNDVARTLYKAMTTDRHIQYQDLHYYLMPREFFRFIATFKSPDTILSYEGTEITKLIARLQNKSQVQCIQELCEAQSTRKAWENNFEILSNVETMKLMQVETNFGALLSSIIKLTGCLQVLVVNNNSKTFGWVRSKHFIISKALVLKHPDQWSIDDEVLINESFSAHFDMETTVRLVRIIRKREDDDEKKKEEKSTIVDSIDLTSSDSESIIPNTRKRKHRIMDDDDDDDEQQVPDDEEDSDFKRLKSDFCPATTDHLMEDQDAEEVYESTVAHVDDDVIIPGLKCFDKTFGLCYVLNDDEDADGINKSKKDIMDRYLKYRHMLQPLVGCAANLENNILTRFFCDDDCNVDGFAIRNKKVIFINLMFDKQVESTQLPVYDYLKTVFCHEIAHILTASDVHGTHWSCKFSTLLSGITKKENQGYSFPLIAPHTVNQYHI